MNRNINTKKTIEQFIEECKFVHGEKYNYSQVDYKSNKVNVKIICEQHGLFEQTPKSHLKGSGCKTCAKSRSKYSKTEIIDKLKLIYKDKYEYPDFEFNSLSDKIILICKKHGEILKSISNHLKSGCRNCHFETVGGSTKKNKVHFIEKSNQVHNNRFDYTLVNYVNSKSKVLIICNEHGEFQQTPGNHMNGQGCPKCSTSKGERSVERFLKENGINYSTQHIFPDCRYVHTLKFDFYLYDFNVCIEFDGYQHNADSKSKSMYYDESIRIRDEIKTEYCIKNSIKLIRIKYHSIKNIDSILSKILKSENIMSMEKKKETFIKKSIELWGYKYDYSRVDYIDYKTPVRIGYKGLWYSQTPSKHLQGKKIECQESRMSNENFIILSKKVWGEERFDYSECEYLGTSVKIKLYDKLRKKWIEQIPKSHLKGFEVIRLTKEEFFHKCDLIHDFKYEYNVEDFNSGLNSRITIICKVHGVFNLKASSHIYGTCCSKCDEYKFTKFVRSFLEKNKIIYLQQHYFDRDDLPFDFYIPSLRTCIEFDGKHHFEPLDYFGGLKAYESLKVSDKIKNDYCEDNYIDLIRIRYDQIDRIFDILKESLKNRI